MDRTYDELGLLIALLEAEGNGQPFDHGAARHLTDRLAVACPEIAGTLGLIGARMTAQRWRTAA